MLRLPKQIKIQEITEFDIPYVNYCIGNHNADDPLVSPLFGDQQGLLPIHIQSDRNEILLDDSVRFYEKAKQEGVNVPLKIWDDMFHVFQLFSFFPETQESLNQISAFVSKIMDDE